MIVEEHGRLARRERQVLAGMITDAALLGRAASVWDGRNFESPQCNLAGGWAVDHFRKYREAPGQAVRRYYRDWRDSGKATDALSEQVASVLEYASKEFEEDGEGGAGPQHRLDLANALFDEVRLRRLAERVTDTLDAGDVDAARREAVFRGVSLGGTAGTHFFTDKAEVLGLVDQEAKPLFSFPGPLGDFFQGQLEAEGFLGFIAPNKTGKSFWLQEVAYRAMCRRRRVAVFVIGDMSRRQYEWRLASRVAAWPRRNPTGAWPYRVGVPTGIRTPGEGDAHAAVEVKVKEYPEKLTPTRAWAACRRLMRDTVKSRKSYFWFKQYPAKAVSVAGIVGDLDALALEDWVPDVVVIDYADNLAPLDRRAERRDQVNDTWTALSALRSERRCLLVTASQADTASFSKGLLDRNNFSEDRRKLDHVTGMIGINQTAAEKKAGVVRLNWINTREGDMPHTAVVHVAGCLALSNPAVKSCF